MKQARFTLIGAATIAAMSFGVAADTEFKFGGYVKADVMFSDYSNGAPGSGSLSRQFYVPGTIYGDARQWETSCRLPGKRITV